MFIKIDNRYLNTDNFSFEAVREHTSEPEPTIIKVIPNASPQDAFIIEWPESFDLLQWLDSCGPVDVQQQVKELRELDPAAKARWQSATPF